MKRVTMSDIRSDQSDEVNRVNQEGDEDENIQDSGVRERRNPEITVQNQDQESILH